jgi:hypothetical protein
VIVDRVGKKFSSNTGLSSYKSISKSELRLLQLEAELVTSHELGHNWGSEHDPTDKQECVPLEKGNYIMYAFANKGYDPNNFVSLLYFGLERNLTPYTSKGILTVQYSSHVRGYQIKGAHLLQRSDLAQVNRKTNKTKLN